MAPRNKIAEQQYEKPNDLKKKNEKYFVILENLLHQSYSSMVRLNIV